MHHPKIKKTFSSHFDTLLEIHTKCLKKLEKVMDACIKEPFDKSTIEDELKYLGFYEKPKELENEISEAAGQLILILTSQRKN